MSKVLNIILSVSVEATLETVKAEPIYTLNPAKSLELITQEKNCCCFITNSIYLIHSPKVDAHRTHSKFLSSPLKFSQSDTVIPKSIGRAQTPPDHRESNFFFRKSVCYKTAACQTQ